MDFTTAALSSRAKFLGFHATPHETCSELKPAAEFSGLCASFLGAGSQVDARLLRKILGRSGLRVGARKSF